MEETPVVEPTIQEEEEEEEGLLLGEAGDAGKRVDSAALEGDKKLKVGGTKKKSAKKASSGGGSAVAGPKKSKKKGLALHGASDIKTAKLTGDTISEEVGDDDKDLHTTLLLDIVEDPDVRFIEEFHRKLVDSKDEEMDAHVLNISGTFLPLFF